MAKTTLSFIRFFTQMYKCKTEMHIFPNVTAILLSIFPCVMVNEAHCAHILVKTQKEAKELKARIENGEDFGTLAQQYSSCPSKAQGGDLGWFGPGQMVKPFEHASFSGKPGDIAVCRTQFGWHVIRILEQR